MKNLAITITALVFSLTAFAGGNLQGPKGKNAKPWDGKERGTEFVKTVETQRGPEAKNTKAWDGKEIGETFEKGAERITGPKYKNGRF